MRSPQEQAIGMALLHLVAARDLLKTAKAPRATAKVRAAITSSQGAQRNAQVRAGQARYEAEIAGKPPIRYEVRNA